MKEKQRTLSQGEKIGFDNIDLKSPTHDEMLKKVLDKNFLLKIIKTNENFRQDGWVLSYIWDVMNGKKPPYYCTKHNISVEPNTSTIHENSIHPMCPISRSYDYDEKFTKCSECYNCTIKEKLIERWNFFKASSNVDDCIKYEIEPVIKNGNYVVGFCDLIFEWKNESDKYNSIFKNYKSGSGRKRYFIEIKTKIPSLGAIIREIKFYKAYLEKEIIPVLIVPKISQEEENILEKEGIIVEVIK